MRNSKLISIIRTTLMNKKYFRKSRRNYSTEQRKYMNISGKLAVITGATSDIGQATADHLLKNDAKHVILTGKDREQGHKVVCKLSDQYGEGVCSFQCCDVTSYEETKDLFEDLKCKGGTDILINIAACSCDCEWNEVIDVNYTGLVRTCLTSMKYLGDEKKERVVVNISAIYAIDPCPYLPIFSATKTAVLGFHQSIGNKCHYDQSMIRYIAILPGKTRTCAVDKLMNNTYVEHWKKDAEQYLMKIPEQKPIHVARGIIYGIEYGEPGSMLIVENKEIRKLTMPSRCSYSEHVVSFISNVLRQPQF